MHHVLSHHRLRRREPPRHTTPSFSAIALRATIRVFYHLMSAGAVYLSVMVLRLLSAARITPSAHGSPRLAGLMTGIGMGAAWTLGLGAAAAIVTHSQVIYWTVLLMSLPIGAVVSWHVSRWQE